MAEIAKTSWRPPLVCNCQPQDGEDSVYPKRQSSRLKSSTIRCGFGQHQSERAPVPEAPGQPARRANVSSLMQASVSRLKAQAAGLMRVFTGGCMRHFMHQAEAEWGPCYTIPRFIFLRSRASVFLTRCSSQGHLLAFGAGLASAPAHHPPSVFRHNGWRR